MTEQHAQQHAQPPVHVSREIAVPAHLAWHALTREIGSWWPMATHSVGGAGGSVAFRGGLIVETAPDGTEHAWGEVLSWAPPSSLVTTWHPGRPSGPESTEVEMRVVPLGPDRCRVEVIHTRWERLADPRRLRESYSAGWPVVLAPLAARFEAVPTEAAR